MLIHSEAIKVKKVIDLDAIKKGVLKKDTLWRDYGITNWEFS